MRSITAVEIGADICALARTSVRGGDVHLFAAEALEPGAFPGVDSFTLAVRQSRRTLRLPRRCRAVVWGLPDGARRRDPLVLPLIEPLTRAGFRVDRVVTPCNALGALARRRVSRTGGAMCWLGINRNGVAIVVIRPGKLLYSHSFGLDSNVGASGSQARLLQRYSLVAFLAPEVRRAFAAARIRKDDGRWLHVRQPVDPPRSLTMPLIEARHRGRDARLARRARREAETADKLSETAVDPARVRRRDRARNAVGGRAKRRRARQGVRLALDPARRRARPGAGRRRVPVTSLPSAGLACEVSGTRRTTMPTRADARRPASGRRPTPRSGAGRPAVDTAAEVEPGCDEPPVAPTSASPPTSPHSVLRPPSPILRPPSSDLRPPSSDPSSDLRSHSVLHLPSSVPDPDLVLHPPADSCPHRHLPPISPTRREPNQRFGRCRSC